MALSDCVRRAKRKTKAKKNICEILQPNEVNYYNAKVWMTRAQQNKTKRASTTQHRTKKKRNLTLCKLKQTYITWCLHLSHYHELRAKCDAMRCDAWQTSKLCGSHVCASWFYRNHCDCMHLCRFESVRWIEHIILK